jgi:hypothetical protein
VLFDDGTFVASWEENGFDPNEDYSPLLIKGLMIVPKKWK